MWRVLPTHWWHWWVCIIFIFHWNNIYDIHPLLNKFFCEFREPLYVHVYVCKIILKSWTGIIFCLLIFSVKIIYWILMQCFHARERFLNRTSWHLIADQPVPNRSYFYAHDLMWEMEIGVLCILCVKILFNPLFGWYHMSYSRTYHLKQSQLDFDKAWLNWRQSR